MSINSLQNHKPTAINKPAVCLILFLLFTFSKIFIVSAFASSNPLSNYTPFTNKISAAINKLTFADNQITEKQKPTAANGMPVLVGSLNRLNCFPTGVAVAGNYAYLAEGYVRIKNNRHNKPICTVSCW